MTHYAATVAAPCASDSPAMRKVLDALLCDVLATVTIYAGRMTEAGTLCRVFVRLQRGTAWRVEVTEWVMVSTSNSELGDSQKK